MKLGYMSFNFSSSVDLLYEYMGFRLSCLKQIHENAHNDAQAAPDPAEQTPMDEVFRWRGIL